MKKTLSLLLVLAMVLSSFSFAFAAEAEKTPGEILKDLGVLTGNAEGDLMLEDELSRQDMIVLLSRVLGQEDEAKAFKGEMSFKDVNDPFYKPYIAWAEANKLTNGVEEGKFGFGRAVTEQEVATLMLRALGYNDVEFKDVPAKAAELGLVAKDADLTVNCKRARMAEITLAALGTKMNGSDKTLAEKLGIEMPKPEKLEVVEVKADNLKEIKVVFNKAVDVESATNADNYETDAGEIVDIAYDEDANMAILALKEAMDNKEDYEITINVEKLNVTKEFTAYDNTVPVVEDVVALGTKAIKVIMSEPIKEAKISDFKLDGKAIYGSIDKVGREIVLKPYKALDVKEYELTVGRLEDYAEFKSVESKHGFEVVEDKEKPVVEEVNACLESAVITFSEDVDNSTVSRYNVYWGDKVYPESATKIAGNKVLVVFTAKNALPVYETALHISGFADYSGNKMEPAEVKVKPSIDESRPEVKKVEIKKDKKTIVVTFNKPVNDDKAKDRDNYIIKDKDDNKQVINTISKADALGKVYEVVLSTALDENTSYSIKISGITDNNKYANVMIDYVGTLAVGDFTNPTYVSVSGKHDPDGDKWVSKMYIFFDKEMDLATVADPNNYLVRLEGDSNRVLSSVGGKVDIKNVDGSVVYIEVKNAKKVTHIGVLGVKDTTGKTLSNYGEMKVVNLAIPGLATSNPIVAESKDKVTIKFNMPIKEVKDNAFSITGATIKEVNWSGDTVTLTLDAKLNADTRLNSLVIYNDKVIAFDGQPINVLGTQTIVDKIGPSLIKVERTLDSDNKIKLVLSFDEKLATIDSNTWKTDLVVTRVATGEKVTNYAITQPSSDLNKLEIKFDNLETVNSTYDVSVVSGARFIKDEVANNAAKAGTVRSVDTVATLNDSIDVALAAANLTADTIKGTNVDLNNVTANLVLPTVGTNGTTIAWTSDNAAVNATNGTVTRPAYSAGDATVKLTATITKGTATVTKQFTVEVLKRDVVSATINPAIATYNGTADVITTITLNDATSITKINDGTADLTAGTDYTFAGNTLTIKTSYLDTKLVNSGDQVVLTITFDAGNTATLTITK